MKTSLPLFVIASVLFLTSCETTKEITLNADGGGTTVTTTDMSSLLSMAKMSGQGKEELEKMGEAKFMDTTISVGSMADMLTNVSPEELELVKQGTIGFTMDMKNDKLLTKLSFPFSKGEQIMQLDKISAGLVQEMMKKGMDSAKGKIPGGLDDAGLPDASIDDYYTISYSKKSIERKLDKEKYANVDKDEKIQGLKQLSSVGGGGTILIYNLPSPAKKAEGKRVTLSEDKMKVTISSSADDFFEDGSSLEFKIEY